MANWTVIGELGAGKTILSVAHVRDNFLLRGLKVASNVDMFLEYLMPPMSKVTYLRLTDFPELKELQELGKGGDTKREKDFGLVFLDEVAMFLNARSWQKDGRDDFIIFQRHLRKRRWHSLLLTQDVESMDKQARNALVERVVRCGRTDRIKLPVIGKFLQFFGFSGMRKQKHIGYVYYGKFIAKGAVYQQKWDYEGQNLWLAYDTEQEFEPLRITKLDNGMEDVEGRKRLWRGYANKQNRNNEFEVEIVGKYTVLSAWHLYGRYLTWYQIHEQKIRIISIIIILLGAAVVGFAAYPTQKIVTPINDCITPNSFIRNGNHVTISHDNVVFDAKLENGKAVTKFNCYNLELKK